MTMERLLAYGILSYAGFITGAEYQICLEQLLSEQPENPLLAELEVCSGDLSRSIQLLEKEFREKGGFSLEEFGRFFFQELESAYHRRRDLASFSRMAYRAWGILPVVLQQLPPFRLLGYGAQTFPEEEDSREYYLQAFRSFRQQ